MADAKDKPVQKQAVDWERIEVEYRAGVLSLRELAKLHPGTNHVAITRRAKKEGWPRDLSKKIRQRVDELVTRAAVTPEETAQRVATEREVIEATALQIARVKREHRATGARINALGLALLREVEIQTADPALLEQLGELMRQPDDNGMDKLNDLYRKIISTPSRVDSGKKAAEMLKCGIGIDRDAWGLAEAAPSNPLESMSEAEMLAELDRLKNALGQ